MNLRKIKHLFIPHSETHRKAPLLSWHYLVIYILLFILLRVSIDLVEIYKPGVLGITSNIDSRQLIEETNKERQKQGLLPLAENSTLDQAARLKAANMFEENYWAHFSPSGKDPWGFILSSGYKFSYAGENLARNFYNSPDVVSAWMASSSHRDNILNPKYQDIGIAVVDGVLDGQKTTLVVQMFGKPYEPMATALPQINVNGQKIDVQTASVVESKPVLVEGPKTNNLPHNQFVIDPFVVARGFGIFLICGIGILLILDFIVLKRRGVFRISSHHIAHLSFLAVAGASLLLSRIGEIL
ncbi:MAG: CAP domain-containing protein [Candidatus Daviesbacteria bacterium]